MSRRVGRGKSWRRSRRFLSTAPMLGTRWSRVIRAVRRGWWLRRSGGGSRRGWGGDGGAEGVRCCGGAACGADGYGWSRVAGGCGVHVVCDCRVAGGRAGGLDAVVVAGAGGATLSGAPGARPGLVLLGVPEFVFGPGPAAPCRADPEAWFAEGVRAGRARVLCAGCGYLEACGAFALERSGLWGVWGGMTRLERESLRRRSRGGVGGSYGVCHPGCESGSGGRVSTGLPVDRIKE
jgi:WhiB family redox-sensing transcriptional regulator